MLKRLSMIHMNSPQSKVLYTVYMYTVYVYSKEERVQPSPKLTVGSLHVIESVFIIMGYLFTESHKYINDYRYIYYCTH